MKRCPLCLREFIGHVTKEDGRPVCTRCGNQFDGLREVDRAKIGAQIAQAEAICELVSKFTFLVDEAADKHQAADWFEDFKRGESDN